MSRWTGTAQFFGLPSLKIAIPHRTAIQGVIGDWISGVFDRLQLKGASGNVGIVAIASKLRVRERVRRTHI
jgi:hypothetical protein